MKEKLIKFIMERADKEYSDDFPINNIPIWIEEFFEKYESCKLGHDFFTIPLSDQRDCTRCREMYDPKKHGE